MVIKIKESIIRKVTLQNKTGDLEIGRRILALAGSRRNGVHRLVRISLSTVSQRHTSFASSYVISIGGCSIEIGHKSCLM